MKSKHVDKLLSSYSLGTQIKFEYHLSTWQNTFGTSRNKINVPEQSITTDCNENSIKHVDLHSVLNTTAEGKLVMDYYKQNDKLNDLIRGKLVDLIIHYLFLHNYSMSVKLAESIADQIHFIFPNKIKVRFFASIKLKVLYMNFYMLLHNVVTTSSDNS